MISFLTNLDASHPAVFAVSAAAALGTMAIAYANFRRTQMQQGFAAVTELQKLLTDVRSKRLFEDVATVNKTASQTGGWAVLGEADGRARAARILTVLCKTARTVGSHDAWHKALDGAEWKALLEFLSNVEPLIIAVRRTKLELSGKEQFYNGNKKFAAAELYQALNIRGPLSSPH